MKQIAVIGSGQGGMLTALKLAQQGFDVTVYEKSSPSAVSYDWYDDIRADIFNEVGIPMPPSEIYRQKGTWCFVSPDQKNRLNVPPAKPMEEVSVSRRGLSQYLADLLIRNGGKILYDTEVTSLWIKQKKIIGLKIGKQKLRYDLVIDASGLSSPFRAQVPEKFGIQKQAGTSGILNGYRAFYQKQPGAEDPDPECTMYIKHLGGVGISWCNLNKNDEIDVLIAKIGELSDSDIDRYLNDMKQGNPILSGDRISARRVSIALRCCLPVFVADGYTLVGDSACMTMPLMGSGIESSMKAGAILAETILQNGNKPYTAKNLWNYETAYFKALGKDYILIDVLKRWAFHLEAGTVDWAFGCGIVTNEDMALVTTDENAKIDLSIRDILRRLRILFSNKPFIRDTIHWVIRALKARRIAQSIPKSYRRSSVRRWSKKYTGFLEKVDRDTM